MKSAGVMFVSGAGNVLFLKRAPTAPDCPDCWDFPGGGQEGDETAEETAIRETREEIGFVPDGKRQYHTRQAPGSAPIPAMANAGITGINAWPPPEVDFTTFIQRVNNEFTPDMDSEHVGYAWSPVTSPPQPLHPGCTIALERLSMDELGVARAIAAGRLTSPQRYANVWLFSIRITGTDIAYRSKYDEFVHRNPDHYLNEEFLARCNGLAVIWKHPKKALLDSKEFSDRIVGTIFLPYIDGDEVWGIAKIYDEGAALAMDKGQLSTSPSVFFEDLSVNTKLVTEDGRKVLIEGKPSLLDHVAIAELGVWDKGSNPTGIRSESREDSHMSAEDDKAKKDAEEKETKEREDKAKKDAEDKSKADAATSEKLDKMLSFADGMSKYCDSMTKRMDAFEKQRDDAAKADAAKKDAEDKKKEEPEKVAADKAKKDAEDKEEKEKEEKAKKDAADKARDDAARADSNEALMKRIKELETTLATGVPMLSTHQDYGKMADHQSRADEVIKLFGIGKGAPEPMRGETENAYRRRLARSLQPHCEKWKLVDLTSVAFADEAIFVPIESDIYQAAWTAGMRPDAGIPDGEMRPKTRRLDSGHTIIEYYAAPGVGPAAAWANKFAGPVRNYHVGPIKLQKH
jgi:8-oxo-dGTP pyrophosphatase MutT (NUDIX family)